jgi:hypothetical protein
MPGQRIANAAAALFATGSMVIGQPLPAQSPAYEAAPASESFVEILTGPESNGYTILPSTNCGCGCSHNHNEEA